MIDGSLMLKFIEPGLAKIVKKKKNQKPEGNPKAKNSGLSDPTTFTNFLAPYAPQLNVEGIGDKFYPVEQSTLSFPENFGQTALSSKTERKLDDTEMKDNMEQIETVSEKEEGVEDEGME